VGEVGRMRKDLDAVMDVVSRPERPTLPDDPRPPQPAPVVPLAPVVTALEPRVEDSALA